MRLMMMMRWWRGRRAKDAVAMFETMSVGSMCGGADT